MAEQSMTPDWIEGEPAFLLQDGVGYVREWARAQYPVSVIRETLESIGHTDAMPYLRADVNVFGAGFVELGRVTPETAALIARGLRALAAVNGIPDEEQAA